LVTAQTPAAPPTQEQRPPVFRSEANFVRVDVYPTKGDAAVTDLRADEFEVLEDNVPQAVQTFEHVVIHGGGPQSARTEPNSVGQSLQMVANPRNRVFVIFLDGKHVTIGASWNIRRALINLIDRMLAPEDLIAVMTSDMAASEITFSRKTDIIASNLMSLMPWGRRDMRTDLDPREQQYQLCFPTREQEPVVAEMIARRRERMTLDSLRELVLYLRNIREERKAILAVSEGWLLFRENQALTTMRGNESMPGGLEPIGTGPDGRITRGNPRDNNYGATLSDCWADRHRLAAIDDQQYFRDIIGEANRGNASFYTVDPRGLAVFDTSIEQGVSLNRDATMLRSRQGALRDLASGTDGIAMMDTNDMNASLKRMADDLASYYLLGYYSTNGNLDGRFRNIKVRVKRPGVNVRARRGYRAATEAEIVKGRATTAVPVPEIVTAMSSSMGTLDRVRPGVHFYVNAVPVSAAGGSPVATVWVAGELQPSGPSDPWLKGGTAEIEIRNQGTSSTAQATIAAGERGFVVPVTLAKAAGAGQIDVRVRLVGTDPAADREIDSLSVDVASARGRPLAFRRGPTRGNRLQPVATFHFNRSDRARLEMALAPDAKPGAARIIDRSGQPLQTPVTVGERTDAAGGQRWLTADFTLASLSPGDYAVELTAITTAGEQRIVTAVRVLR
jgi:VWFA-related protein